MGGFANAQGFPNLPAAGLAALPGYQLVSNGSIITAYDSNGAVVTTANDIGAVYAALTIPATGCNIRLRNDGHIFPSLTRIFLPRNLTGWLYFQGDGSTIQIQAGASTPTAFSCVTGNDYDTFGNVWIDNLIVDRNNISSSSSSFFSNTASGRKQRLNIDGIKFTNINIINTPTADGSTHLTLEALHLAAAETQTVFQNVLIDNFKATGGTAFIQMIGQNNTAGAVSEIFFNNVTVRNFSFDSLTVPSASSTGFGVQVGSVGFGDRVTVQSGYIANVSDVGVEIDGIQNALVDNVEIVDPFNTGILVRNFHAATDVEDQVNVVRDCTVTMKSCTAPGIAGFLVNNTTTPTAAFGTAILDSCTMADGQNPLAVGNGRFVKVSGTSVRRLVLENMTYVADAISDATVGSKTNNTIVVAPNTDLLLEVRNVRLKLAGSTTNGSMTVRLFTIAPTASAEVSCTIEDLWADMAVTGVTAGNTIGLGLGEGSTGKVRGKLDGFRVVQWTGDTAPVGVQVSGTGTLTIDGRFLVTNCDFSKMPAGCVEISVDSTQTALGALLAVGNVYKTIPAPVGFTGLVSAAGKRLGAQAATVFWPAMVTFTQGTGTQDTAIDYSTNGGTTYTNFLTQAAGALPAGFDQSLGPLLPADLIKVTFGAGTQPTITLVPVNP